MRYAQSTPKFILPQSATHGLQSMSRDTDFPLSQGNEDAEHRSNLLHDRGIFSTAKANAAFCLIR